MGATTGRTGSADPNVSNTPKEALTTKEQRWDRLKVVTKELNKQFKTTTALVRMNDKVGVALPSLSTGLPSLDHWVLGCGGIPKGRLIELYGIESSGKTTLALHIAGLEQKRGGIVAYIDVEHALDATYAAFLGVDMDELLIAQPDSGEQALETVDALVDSTAVSLIIVDSVAALVPQAELNGEVGTAFIGLQARMMGQACRKLRGKCAINGVPIIFLNQIREKTGVVYGSPEVTPGGRALKFQASVRLDVRRKDIKEGDELVGQVLVIKASKNKVGIAKRSTTVDLIWGKGLDVDADFISYAKTLEVIKQSGAWLSFQGTPLGQGVVKAGVTIKADPELRARIEREITARQQEM